MAAKSGGMYLALIIDVAFDLRNDAAGRDPDVYSPTLRFQHQQLWSKKLASGLNLNLAPRPGKYLATESDNLVFSLTSDSISNSFRAASHMQKIISEVERVELDAFQRLGSTIGAKILFPGKKIGGHLTINVARGFSRSIADRFDLTLECIRRQYLNEPNPLSRTLEVYWAFFDAFGSFEGYVDFFLLNDLANGDEINFFLPFEDFRNSPWPADLNQYRAYMKSTMDFVAARNRRIAEWVKSENEKLVS